MAFKLEEIGLSKLLKSPILLGITAIIVIILLIFGAVLLWAYKLLTAVIIGGFLLVISWTLLQTKAIPTEKYPWATLILIILPFFGFFLGMWGEKTGAFYVTPLMEKPETVAPFYAAEPLQFVTANIEVILILTLMICIAIVFARAKG